ncbi:hypothetical protein K450DRAFT_301619 [Umbelopsis ramanniana AG]|uniref:Uncharacterized protein n=1 Tax=Umbelopsis ramanniana AG TaxID=1314678 RepID=A0AAD5HB61_UMBRA|nr:uncharacterized protein K450DRAFT_301619 [Umbelopsis ramanniana AG]KAI8577800.1 hypothetical protein K450DRAFT_301619 [Umbelopsis ramanniana AG]
MPPEVNAQTENSIIASPVNVRQLQHTSDWGQEQMKSFRMSLKSEEWASKFYNKYLYEEAKNIIVELPLGPENYKDLPAVQKPFLNRLLRLKRYPHYPGVSIASVLLEHTGFETEKLNCIAQPKLEKKFGDLTLISDADYVAIGPLSPLAYMVVIEDLSGKKTFDERRHQMVGDMLVAATTRHNFFLQNESYDISPHIYGMLLWKSGVRFYQATFDHQDIDNRQSKRTFYYKDIDILENRCVPLGNNHKDSLSLFNADDGKIIAYILSGIRKECVNRLSYLFYKAKQSKKLELIIAEVHVNIHGHSVLALFLAFQTPY